MAARLGGDEFAVLIENAREQRQVDAIAQRILQALRQPVAIDGTTFPVRSTIGIAVSSDGVVGDEMLRRADIAMYAAKRSGGSRCEVFRADMSHELGELLGLEQEIRHGLQQGEFARAAHEGHHGMGGHPLRRRFHHAGRLRWGRR